MRQIVFLKQNKEKWAEIEKQLLNKQDLHPDILAKYYIQTINDLAYAQTYYPKSDTVTYLNQISVLFHQEIYRNKLEKKNRFITLWKQEVPLLFFKHQKSVLVAFTIFLVSSIIGWYSSIYQEDFVRLILGDSYVDMTLKNIANDDPMAVYKQMNETPMFLGITFNNVKVSFFAFVSGVFFSIGTGYLLFSNGIMLGAFQAFFYKKGLLWVSFLTIWIHGTLEISAIILAGASGIVLGNSLTFPGTYSRLTSLQNAGREALRMIIGLVPIFIIAGFLEGFATRHTQWPTFVKLAIIITSFIFILYYFIIYPHIVHKRSLQ